MLVHCQDVEYEWLREKKNLEVAVVGPEQGSSVGTPVRRGEYSVQLGPPYALHLKAVFSEVLPENYGVRIGRVG